MASGINTTKVILVLAVCALLPVSLSTTAIADGPGAQEYTFTVRHARMLGDRDGTLTLTAERVEYRSKDGEHGGSWTYRDIQRLEILSKTRIRITTYEDNKFFGMDRVLTLEIVGGELTREVSDFLRGRMPKPFTTWFTDRAGQPIVELAVKHHHRFGGCQGTIAVHDDRLVFVSDSGKGSRTWLWSDLRGVSRPDPFRLELATWERESGGPKAYTFAVKEAMSDAAYEAIWERIYRPTPLRVAAPPPVEHRHDESLNPGSPQEHRSDEEPQ